MELSDIINLNKARKAKLKQQSAAKAVENRVLHGVPAKTRKLAKLIHNRDAEKHESHQLVTPFATKTIDGDQ